jgi:hypothetical protein
VGRSWALFHVVGDLRLDGWECIRLADITATRHGPYERFTEKVLKKESALRNARHPTVPLGETVALMKALQGESIVGLDFEDDDDFVLGKVLRVGSHTAVIHTVDARGKWDSAATRVLLSDITRIQFGDHYGTMFERHAETRHAPKEVRIRLRGPL